MSLINQMLQDLEKRGGDQAREGESTSHYAQYGSEVAERKSGLRFLVWICLLLALASSIYFIFFQNRPKTKLATSGAAPMAESSPASAAHNVDAELLKTASLPLLLKMSTQIDAVLDTPPEAAVIEKAQVVEPVKSKPTLDVTLSTSAGEQANKQVALTSRSTQIDSGLPVVAEIKRADGSVVDLTSVNKQTPDASPRADEKRAKNANEPRAVGLTEKSNQSAVTVIKEISPQQRAEGEFKQATIYQQQGRNSEAVLALEQALKLDPNHAPARQLMISLLLEGKRYDDAIRELRAALANDTHQINFAMILARLMVERAKVNEAVDILQKSAAFAQDRPDYLAFMAALQQKLGRHKEAIQSYRLALNQHKQNPVWWMGIGISLQAEGLNSDALDAYRQAKAQPGLGADLLAFVDQKIAQIQK